MLTSSSSSKRLLVFHGSSPHKSQLSHKLISVEKHNDTITSSFNLQDLNHDCKQLSVTKTSCQTDRKEGQLKALLVAKQEMLGFYRKEQLRRKQRFQRELQSREVVLTETLNNLKNLVWIEAEKNFKLERKIEALRNAQQRPQQNNKIIDQSQVFGYSDFNYFDISRSDLLRKDETLLLQSVNNSSLTLDHYI